MIIVFGTFSFSRVLGAQMIGFGLAIAVLLDATLIRMVLVPAIMHIAGRWNWWPGVPAPLGPADAPTVAEGEEPLSANGTAPSATPTPARDADGHPGDPSATPPPDVASLDA